MAGTEREDGAGEGDTLLEKGTPSVETVLDNQSKILFSVMKTPHCRPSSSVLGIEPVLLLGQDLPNCAALGRVAPWPA